MKDEGGKNQKAEARSQKPGVRDRKHQPSLTAAQSRREAQDIHPNKTGIHQKIKILQICDRPIKDSKKQQRAKGPKKRQQRTKAQSGMNMGNLAAA